MITQIEIKCPLMEEIILVSRDDVDKIICPYLRTGRMECVNELQNVNSLDPRTSSTQTPQKECVFRDSIL